jgi:hypothetical protein
MTRRASHGPYVPRDDVVNRAFHLRAVEVRMAIINFSLPMQRRIIAAWRRSYSARRSSRVDSIDGA